METMTPTEVYSREVNILRRLWQQPQAPYWQYGLLVFLYASLMALLVQTVIIPQFLSATHAGHGLLRGGDWYGFHQLGVEMVQQMKLHGWEAWTLRPHGQAPGGIAAFIYYLTVPEPYTLIPLNALLHAGAVVTLMLIIQQFTDRWQHALLASLPLALFPSAMAWYTQIHKDGWFILGCLLFLYGWLLITASLQREQKLSVFIKPSLLIIAGAFFIWVVRPYGVQMIQGMSVLVVLALIMLVAVKRYQRIISWPQFIAAPLVMVFLLAALTPFSSQGVPLKDSEESSYSHLPPEEIQQAREAGMTLWWTEDHWQQTLPVSLDNLFFTLAVQRDLAIIKFLGKGSAIDTDYHYTRAMDFLTHTPRLLQIALLAPFPNMWFSVGTAGNSSIIRKISGLEMMYAYVCLLLVLLSIRTWGRKPDWWVLIFFCTSMMYIYAIPAINIGSFYRSRYGFMLTLIALGTAYGIDVIGRSGTPDAPWRSLLRLRGVRSTARQSQTGNP